MRNIKLIIEYDGTNYCGWQAQKNGISIQATIQDAIEKITGCRPELHGSGRTDAGVHAKGQVANFHIDSKIKGERFAFALNAVLPEDIVILQSEDVDLDFHSRFNAIGKQYSYHIINRQQPTALYRKYAHYVNYCSKLDIEKMKQACELLKGTHDYAAFMAQGSSIKDTVRTVYDIVLEQKDELIKLSFHGNGFLYNMVRIMSGTILYCGIGKIKAEDIPEIIASKDRTKAGITLPPHGLYLEKVMY
jgi:tRNA pseudouridine38-40 synthase